MDPGVFPRGKKNKEKKTQKKHESWTAKTVKKVQKCVESMLKKQPRWYRSTDLQKSYIYLLWITESQFMHLVVHAGKMFKTVILQIVEHNCVSF